MLILKSRLRPIIGRFWKELFGILKENCGIQLVGSTIEQTNGKFPFVSRFHFRKHCVKMQKASQILIILLGSINQIFAFMLSIIWTQKSWKVSEVGKFYIRSFLLSKRLSGWIQLFLAFLLALYLTRLLLQVSPSVWGKIIMQRHLQILIFSWN